LQERGGKTAKKLRFSANKSVYLRETAHVAVTKIIRPIIKPAEVSKHT